MEGLPPARADRTSLGFDPSEGFGLRALGTPFQLLLPRFKLGFRSPVQMMLAEIVVSGCRIRQPSNPYPCSVPSQRLRPYQALSPYCASSPPDVPQTLTTRHIIMLFSSLGFCRVVGFSDSEP